MRVEDFPRPVDDNRRGIHWSASVHHLQSRALDPWMHELRTMRIKWVKLLDDGDGSSLEVCERLLAEGIMPVVRLHRNRPNPGCLDARALATVRRLVAAGVRYFETNNEPDSPAEWQNGQMPENWPDVVVDNFIRDAAAVIEAGGLPAFPALEAPARTHPIVRVVERGRADLFKSGAWIAIHNYTSNRPLDYPYDAANQDGTPVEQDEYERLGVWAWDGKPRQIINQWRAADKNPGRQLADDPACFLAFQLVEELATQVLGHKVPIISTEGGALLGWRDDRRYPRVTPAIHAELTVAINEFMQGRRQIHGLACPPNYFAVCHWQLGNCRLGFFDLTHEGHAWYGDWWNTVFNLQGKLPVVDAVKLMPSIAVDRPPSRTIAGRLLLTGSGETVPDAQVELMASTGAVAATAADAQGAFAFKDVPAGSYDLRVTPVAGHSRMLAAPEGEHRQWMWLDDSAGSVLGGTLVDDAGAPCHNARIALQRGGTLIEETAVAADGSFRFEGLPFGVYGLVAAGVQVDGIALDGKGEKTVNLKCEAPDCPTGRIEGLVAGIPAGRRLVLRGPQESSGSWGTGQEVRLEAGGSFAFAGLVPGRYRLELAGIGRMGEELQVKPGELYVRMFRLNSSVRGQVKGAAEGTQVFLYAPPPWHWARQAQLEPGSSGGEMAGGTFLFEHLPPGTFDLQVEDLRYSGLQLSGENTLQLPIIDLREGENSRLHGRVADHAGRPQPDVLLLLWCQGERIAQAYTEADGAYSFVHLPAGTYTLEAAGMGVVAGPIVLDGEEERVNDLLWGGAGGVVMGRVRGTDGVVQPGVVVRLLRGSADISITQSGPEGEYRFTALPPGVYSVAAGSAALSSGMRLDTGGMLVHDITLPLEPEKELSHYLLFGDPTRERERIRLALDLAIPYLWQSGAGAGFSVQEASRAERVTIVGDAVPAMAEEILEAAGCQVDRLAGDGYTLAAAVERLLASLKEGDR